MIQAVADDKERGALGMHYTSVPNILKVLNPLFLDDLREKLPEAGDNSRTLLNLRKHMSRIRVFDPACGSGNFLVIAYKEMQAIETEINRRRGEGDRRTDIPLTNFRGIELRDFSPRSRASLSSSQNSSATCFIAARRKAELSRKRLRSRLWLAVVAAVTDFEAFDRPKATSSAALTSATTVAQWLSVKRRVLPRLQRHFLKDRCSAWNGTSE
jgi:hypothetical protein